MGRARQHLHAPGAPDAGVRDVSIAANLVGGVHDDDPPVVPHRQQARHLPNHGRFPHARPALHAFVAVRLQRSSSRGLIFLRAPQYSSVAVKLSWKWLWELHAGMLSGFCISTRHTFRRSGPPPRIPCWGAAPTMKSIELPDATRSAAIAALPSTARPARHVRPTMRPSRLRMQEMRCSVRSIPALLSSPKSPSCIRQDTFQHAGYGISTVLVGARRDCPPMP